MLSTLDILYLVLSFCAITITVVLVMLGSELLKILKDARSIADNIEQISHLVHRVAAIIIPGVERAARSADKTATDVQDTISSLISRFSRSAKKSHK